MKNLFKKILLFIGIVIVAQVFIYEYLIQPIPVISLLQERLDAGDQILYFGDSVIDLADETDTDKSSIAQMLGKLVPSYPIGDVSREGLGAYDAMIDYVSRSPKKPEAVIIHINLVTFSTAWDLIPGMQFAKERFLLTARTPFIADFYRPLAISRAIDFNPVTEKEFLNGSVYYGDKKIGTVEEFLNTDIRSSYIVRYMYNLHPEHRRLAMLENAIDTAQRAGMKPYVYITPINYKTGAKLIGNDFPKQITHNVEVICSIVKSRGIPCLDLSSAVNPEDFQHNNGYPTEHLKQKGREIVAKGIYEFFLKK